ncbi:VG15 protein [Corynebacterium variabile]|uniref:VG15 protein n=1 Tax=Corynebacterium variabile TaxID=1727 RepID=UPI0028B05446|nr:hypothetical protein [Corynebacterium variabile]
MADPWLTHARHLDSTAVLATQALFKAVDANPDMAPEAFQALVAAITQRYGTVAMSSALWALDTGRELADLTDLPAPVPAEAVNVSQVTNSASWALNKTDGNINAAARVMAGPLGRFIRQPARDTVWNSTAAAGTRYARVPGPGACSFCLMLASRGAVYTKGTVLTVGAGNSRTRRETHTRNPNATGGHTYSSGPMADGHKYHDNCSCTAREVLRDADIPQIVNDLQDEWYEVTYDASGHMRPNQKHAWDQHWKTKRAEAGEAFH